MTDSEIEGHSEELRRLSAVLAALVAVREEEIVSCCRDVMDAAFSDSIGRLVIQVLFDSQEPLSLGAIAARCDKGKRSVLPEGRIRIVVDRLSKAGLVVNLGAEEKPKYLLDGGDKRVRILRKIWGAGGEDTGYDRETEPI